MVLPEHCPGGERGTGSNPPSGSPAFIWGSLVRQQGCFLLLRRKWILSLLLLCCFLYFFYFLLWYFLLLFVKGKGRGPARRAPEPSPRNRDMEQKGKSIWPDYQILIYFTFLLFYHLLIRRSKKVLPLLRQSLTMSGKCKNHITSLSLFSQEI